MQYLQRQPLEDNPEMEHEILPRDDAMIDFCAFSTWTDISICSRYHGMRMPRLLTCFNIRRRGRIHNDFYQAALQYNWWW